MGLQEGFASSGGALVWAIQSAIGRSLWAKLSQPEMTRVCKGRRSKADNDPMDESADKSADDIRDVQVATRRLLWHCTNLHVLVKLRYGIDGDGLACMPSMRQHG